LNAIIERDSSRVEKVAVLRLASYNFSAGTPPFADWPSGLRKIINGHSAIIPGGCNIDGKLIHEVDEGAIREQLEIIKSKGLKNVVVVGIGSPTDVKYHQEEHVRTMIEIALGKEVNVVCSHDVAGNGLLARENASILNASILNFARRTIRSFMSAMHHIGLKCPLYLTSNAGHLLPFSEAMQFPIRIFSSGATNSIRGAAFLAGSEVEQNGCIVVDIGGTTTDVGYLMKNGYPRLAKSYTDLAGVKINLEMPSVESVGLGGGSILHISKDSEQVLVGPESVGHDLTTKSLCFGGNIATATDVANALGAEVGTTKASLSRSILEKAQEKIRKTLEVYIDRTKLSPDPCMIILVGGGSILCPPELTGVSKILVPDHAGVANAIGAAMAKISASIELTVDTSEIKSSLALVKEQAIAAAVAKGGDSRSVTVLSEEIVGVPYTEGRTNIKIEVACPADHKKTYQDFLETSKTLDKDVEVEESFYQETKSHQEDDKENITLQAKENFANYEPNVSDDGKWLVSEVDLRFMAIGCYLLGCGGGGSPYATYLQARQLLAEGETISISSFEDLKDNDVLPPVAAVGTPAVSIERPGGDMVLHALHLMSETCKVTYSKMLAVEIGGGNGLEPLIWGSSKHYGISSVDGDLMGKYDLS
jgi:N-methylhydantoinase A/oxoprolinase/acetone carboxylase beta subunit